MKLINWLKEEVYRFTDPEEKLITDMDSFSIPAEIKDAVHNYLNKKDIKHYFYTGQKEMDTNRVELVLKKSMVPKIKTIIKKNTRPIEDK